MHVQLLKVWERIHTSFWFVPTVMTVAAALLSLVSVWIDESITDEWLKRQNWAYTGGAESASTVLGTIAWRGHGCESRTVNQCGRRHCCRYHTAGRNTHQCIPWG